MSAALRMTDEDLARARLKEPILHYLRKMYPQLQWDVLVDLTSGTACLMVPQISLLYGYYIFLDASEHTMQVRLKSAGGSICERFGINKSNDLNNLARRTDGEAVLAAEGNDDGQKTKI